MDKGLLKITEIFMISSSFLVAALGTADSNPHRVAVSLVGMVVSLLWLVCTAERTEGEGEEREGPPRPVATKIMRGMPVLFILTWLVSAVLHAMIWNQPVSA